MTKRNQGGSIQLAGISEPRLLKVLSVIFMNHESSKLSRDSPRRTDAADMLKRRLKQVGLPAHYSPYSFRATGITNFPENDGTLEAAQRIAGHATAAPRNSTIVGPKGFARRFGEDSVLIVTWQRGAEKKRLLDHRCAGDKNRPHGHQHLHAASTGGDAPAHHRI